MASILVYHSILFLHLLKCIFHFEIQLFINIKVFTFELYVLLIRFVLLSQFLYHNSDHSGIYQESVKSFRTFVPGTYHFFLKLISLKIILCHVRSKLDIANQLLERVVLRNYLITHP